MAEPCAVCGGPLEEGEGFEFRLAGVFNMFEDGKKRPTAFAMRSFTLCSNECGRKSLSKWCDEFIDGRFPESEDSNGQDQETGGQDSGRPKDR